MVSSQNKITEGVIWKEVILFFIPIVISTFFQHFYTLVDGIIVGEFLGTAAFSAVGGSASKIITLVINFFVGVSSGITSYTARYFGRNDMTGVKKTLYNGVVFFVLLGLLFTVLGIFYSDEILKTMETPVETFELSKVYLNTFLFGLIFCVLYNTMSGVLRAVGDSKTPLYVLIFCSFLNIALDLIFVIQLKMGVFGVAFATLIAQGLSAILLGGVLYKNLPKSEKISYKLERNIIYDICVIGIPAGVQSMMYSFSNILVQSTINSFGYLAVASWSAYVKIDTIVGVFVSSLGNTVITFVGQNLGARKFQRVRESVRSIIFISYIISGVVAALFILFRFNLLSLFSDNEEVIKTGTELMFIILPMHLLGIPQTMFSQALRGLGKSFVPMMMTLVGVVGVRFIWVLFIYPLKPNIYFLAACYPVSSVIMSVIFTIYYLYEVRKMEG